MNRKIAIIGAVTLFLTFAALQPGVAKDKNGGSSGSSMAGQHDGLDSGRDFGQHVRGMNDHFSGARNPGQSHKGYSGLKD